MERFDGSEAEEELYLKHHYTQNKSMRHYSYSDDKAARGLGEKRKQVAKRLTASLSEALHGLKVRGACCGEVTNVSTDHAHRGKSVRWSRSSVDVNILFALHRMTEIRVPTAKVEMDRHGLDKSVLSTQCSCSLLKNTVLTEL